MRIGRVTTGAGEFLARIEGDAAIPLAPDPGPPHADPLRLVLADRLDLATAGPIGDPVSLDEHLLAPIREPSKLLAIGRNYAEHARETGSDVPASPVVFVKTNNSITGPAQAVRWRKDDAATVDYEAELAVVVGRRARDVGVEQALDHVFGYTCCNDVSARDSQFSDGQWTRAKSFDTFSPIGPWIVTTDEIRDPQALQVQCRVNGQVMQDASTADMIFGVAALVAYISRFMTLEPGDVISTGTPPGVGMGRKPPVWLQDGDVVEVDIDAIGVLRNTITIS